MTHEEKIEWMAIWCAKNKLQLELEGSCGFGRPCVGVLTQGKYPDYYWYDSEYEREDNNGEVWTPEDAYHKHECVAVLGHGQYAEEQLYNWLKWFDENNFKLEVSYRRVKSEIDYLLGNNISVRMVKQ